ncbi:ATP-binding cassette subfamily C member 4-like isoform X6 [Diorhabda carinulata]|uniref:ATP-binding cassette subfamily C member 4-like isoform X6 n=1 Tax=Diorhabda carinulata TaxID=1163345 RepID=UPI0025A0F3BA|nr:ATP-binding cassette subfamily C member 4-like isoform X6 [Diorhabda carinulata]
MDTEKVESKNENPKKDAGFINKLFFGWMISLIRKRREINLELHDFYNVFDEDDSKVLGNRLQKNWKSEIVKSQQSKRKPSLLKAIVKTFLFEVMFYGIFWFFSNVLIRCTQPLILARLISLFGEEFNEKNTEKMYFYSTMLIVTSILTAFMSNHIELGLSAIGMRIRIACSSLLYRKMIRLDFKSLEVAAVDRVVDLLSNDVNRFDFVINSIHSFWTIPVQILVLTYFVWEQVGFSCLAGVATMIIITLTLQGFVSKLMGKLRSKISQRTDERLKLMTEIISGIQLIKINGWEKRFEALVDCARKKEMIAITAASYLRGVVSSCFVFLEKTALALTVICYVGSGHRITAEKVFSIAQAYGILHISLSVLLPEAMTRRSETSTSVERLRDFLLLDEKPHGAIEPMIKTGIIVTEVDASWTNQTKTLTDLSVQIPRGCLCAVIGPTGAGKSSLLHLLLGELAAKSGRIQLGGHVSYCSQEAWLSNSTVRGNITFGNPYDERCYDKIVKVCDLGVDFERLPRGDRTVCDERGGVSLSGGQRAKIHLARAVYKQADIYLLDDPLSAVDARVGKLLFEECILKYLKGKTRILVTRQLEHLKAADFVVVLNEGKIEATGTFRELCKSKIDFTEMLVKKNAKSEKYEKPTEIEVTTNFPSNKNFISKSKNKYYHGKSRLKPYNGEDVVNNGGVNEADIVKNKKDVVKHVEDVVNNGNIVKYKADIVKHENDAVKRKEDVVKQKEDVVKHVEDVVNNGNIVKYKADIVKHENDAVKRKEDVVKQKEDVVNNGNIVKYKADIVKHENDAVKRKEDVVKQKEDVVKHVEDVVNNGNIVKYKADIVKHENDAVKRKEDVVKQKEDVVNNGNIVKYKADIVKHENDAVKRKEDVVKQKEDVVKHVEDVVNNGNIVKYKADIVKHENDAVKRKEDVVKQKEDVVNNGIIVKYKADIVKHREDIVKHREDIVKHENDIVKQKEDVVNNGNIVKYKADIVKHREDIVKHENDIVKQKEDVVNNGNMVKYKADIVKHKIDVVNKSNMGKDKADLVKHREDIVKHKNDIVKQKEVIVNNGNVVKDKADIVKHREDIVKHREDIVKHKNDIVKQKEVVVNNGNMVEDKADIVKHEEDIVKCKEDVENSNDIVEDKADKVKHKEDIVKNKEDMANNGNIIKDKADIVKYEEDVVEDKEDIVKNKEDVANNGNIKKDKADVVKYEEDIVEDKEDIVKNKKDMANNGNIMKDNNDIVNNDEDGLLNDYNKNKGKNYLLKKYVLAAKRVEIAIVTLLLFLLTQILSSGVDLWVTFWTSQEELRHQNTSITLNVSSSMSRYHPEEYAVRVFYVNGKHSMGKYGYSYQETIPVLKTTASRASDGVFDTVEINGVAHNLVKTNLAAILYALLMIMVIVLTLVRSWLFFKVCMMSSVNMHKEMFDSLMEAPLEFFDTDFSVKTIDESSKDTGSTKEVMSKVSMTSQQTTFSNSSKPGRFSKESGSFNGVLSKVSMGSQQTTFSNSSKPGRFSKETGSFNGVLSKVSMGSQQTTFSNSSKPGRFSKESGSFNGVLSKVSMGSQQTTFSNSSKPGRFSKETGSFNGVLSKVSMGSQQTTFSNSSKPGRFSKETGSFNGVLSKVSMGSQQTTFSNSSKPGRFSKETGSFNGVLSKVSMGSQQTTFSNSSKPGRFSKETGSFNGVLSKVSMGSQQISNKSEEILNRFSKDTGSVDEVLPRVLMDSIQVMLTLGGIFVNLLYSNPYYIVATLLLGTVFVKFGNLYTSTAEIFKRLEKKTKSPMISHITSSINGIVTIRASKAESMLTDKFDVHQNLHTSASYLKISSVSAFGLWLDLICVIQLTVIILSFLILHKYTDVNGSLVGLAISQSMILGAALRYGLNRTAEAKNRLTSVEKVLQYTEIKNEKPSETEKEFFPPESWPGKGKIEFRNIFLKCSDDDLGVLRNINFTILPGEKIGIVGRTGAGKTSLISVLFRLVRFDGSVLIDDVDTKQIGREFIRKKISIIPREPILFSSTIRYNLDPYNEYNDEEMWKALEQVELSNCVSSLDLKVSDDGSNFNLGQKQLIYLARALLRNNKILILDEATANVDHRTDALIQATIRNRFKNCTVITIAHRLNTIMEYNKVMVMSDGKLVEIGHPHHLLDNNKGHFHKLVLETGPEMSSKLKEVAMMTYYEDYTHCFYIK